uniref:Rpl-30 protein n=1 Tax=Caenorhabditis elegans TaxID=6239 RepID=A0A146I8Q1_CAEEL|nr:rpl-30 [Caenorhabditis elegans]
MAPAAKPQVSEVSLELNFRAAME